jgi:hypothetical protein
LVHSPHCKDSKNKLSLTVVKSDTIVGRPFELTFSWSNPDWIQRDESSVPTGSIFSFL